MANSTTRADLAAATASGLFGDAVPEHEVLADHPFFFVLRDRTTDAALFVGARDNPTVS